ncbi:class I SAM-dependent methyltransferase [Pseudoteredinibacter isoporae]|uniref:O-antigen chain-terminating methyltransferase n=1 Tax=Pseudoteredinibacter isoporae TaxID=570281 RepID=A0A7X0JRN9_9GAMM|nr:class I SAM-dependent methyltransferase [Pseudoteredinibacter isoporae]MBB6520106.1 O-antigen chain-terminating methyltransferase [Pseudoteredinibacter isoporae]NHO85678.1 class I SAM-dependent methyltransferase [Pseudoteredinibacter isoporae]NIB25870.1 class I SAM-dependent methyltransferase [Pseudoteredinibacter isoporae]
MEETDKNIVLVVSESKRQPGGLVRGVELHYMDYAFSDEPSTNGLSAWVDGDLIKVKNDCEGFAGVYRQQALNRLFAQQILNLKPSRVLVIGVNGASIDLLRVATLMGVAADVLIDNNSAPQSLLPAENQWLGACLQSAARAYVASDELIELWQNHCESELLVWGESWAEENFSRGRFSFDYSIYEFCLRDHPLLMAMQQFDVRHFEHCEQVLDLGCGAGLFLQLLTEQGISAHGVERDSIVAEYGRAAGLDIICDDALKYLEKNKRAVDGIYCSHFVEHLPIELVESLIEHIATRLNRGGVAVLTFPDPESIRSQLLGFWRDPEHVRFYHPELITTIASVHGLACEWSSYDEQPHQVYPFPETPDVIEIHEPKHIEAAPESWWQKLLSHLGIASRADLQHIEQLKSSLDKQQQALVQLKERTEKLWQINQTWAWNDNVTLRFRKR